jgi:hydrogenase/urease accessory protein HupE
MRLGAAAAVLAFAAGAAVLLGFPATPAAADEFKPAYLQVTELGRGSADYEVLWRLPALDERTLLRVAPAFPPGTRELTARSSVYASGAAVQRWRMRVEGGLDGKSVSFPGLGTARIEVLVRYLRADGTAQLGRVTAVDDGFAFRGSPGAYEVARTYTTIGTEHILRGYDHLLFVLALVILVDGMRRLIWTVTAFTAAHSITLAAATLGLVHVPGPPVEASIALSIAFVAAEIIQKRQGRLSLTQRYPWVIAFAFGLLHGLGFASALAAIGLPQNAIPLALFFFNVGVEIGQLLFIAAVLALGAVARAIGSRLGISSPAWAWRLPPYAIGSLAAFWTIERLASFA